MTLRASTILFIAMCGLLVGIKVLFDLYPGDFPAREQAAAFTWPLVAGIIAIGIAGLFANRAARLPDPLSDRKRDVEGLLWTSAFAVLYGAWTVYAYLRNPDEWVHMALPWSIPFYTFGAIFIEFLLRLGALSILFWLLHVLILRRHFRLAAFWLVASVVGLYEIQPHLMDDVNSGNWLAVALALLGPLYWTHLVEAGLMLRYGWFAPILFRFVFYVVWHMAFGGLAAPS
jgi:hypothetical protein